MNAAIMTPGWCADVWAMHQIFRNLGFTPDEIYFDCAIEVRLQKPCVFVSVKKGEKSLTVTIAEVEAVEADGAVAIWGNYVDYINAAPDAERKAIYDASKISAGSRSWSSS